MRLIEKNNPEITTNKFGVKTILIFRHTSKFHGFIEYTATRRIKQKVYRVDKSEFNQSKRYSSYYPNSKPMFNCNL